MQYSTSSSNSNNPRGGGNPANRGQNAGSPRYREAGRGTSNPSGRGRGEGQKKQNVWTQKGKTPQPTTPETEFLSKYGVDSSNNDSTDAVVNQMNTLSVQDRSTEHRQNTRNPKTREERSNGNGATHTEQDGQKQDRRKTKERRERPQFQPKEPHQQQSQDMLDEKARLAHAKATKLSLAEFHSSISTTDDQENGANEPPSRILWVGNIGPDVSEEELEQEFGQFGKIESLRILHNRFCAFVNFETEEAAKEAKDNLNNTIIGSQYIVIHYRKPEQVKSPSIPIQGGEGQLTLNSPSRALWVGNVSDEVAEEELLSEFERYGKIESIRVLRAKTCAFVNFTTIEEASAALQALQGKKLGNMAIKVNFGKPQAAVPKSLQPDPTQQYLGGPNMPPGFVPADYTPYPMGNVPPGMPPYGVFPPGYYPMMEGYQMYDPAMYDPGMFDPAMFIQYVPYPPQMYGMPGAPNPGY